MGNNLILDKRFNGELWILSFDVCGRVEEAVGKTIEAAVDVMHAVIRTTLPASGSVWVDARDAEHEVDRVENVNVCYVICTDGVEVALGDWHYDMQLITDAVTKSLIARLMGSTEAR